MAKKVLKPIEEQLANKLLEAVELAGKLKATPLVKTVLTILDFTLRLVKNIK